MDLEPLMTEILRHVEVECKDKLETAHGVEIHPEALFLACVIALRYSNVLLANDNEEGGSDNREVLLREKAAELVEKACVRLRHDLDTDAEEDALGMDEYYLCRALVELEEINKEKVQKEYEDLMDKWDRFTRKSKPIMMSRTRSTRRAEELYMLEQLRRGLVSSLQEAEPNNKTKMKPIFGVAQSLSSLISELLLSTHENLKENLTVTPRLVAEVAGPLTGVPASWLLRCSEPPLQGLESRLAERLIGQDHVRFLISNALLRQRSGPRPVGSFLFLYGSGMGRTEHAKALAKQIFDNSDLLTEFDMSEYMDSDSVSRLIGVPSSYKECGVEGMLTEAVRRRPYSVILFDNVDMAHPAVVDVLIEILSHGRVLVDQGNSVDFTKTLIVLTSNAIDGNFRLWGCDCIWRSQDCPVKDNLYSDRWEQNHRCIYPSLLREARRYFKPELFEKLDDVIVFKCLSPEQSMAIGRLQLRDIASSITEKKLILYPSEAALRCMGGEVLRILLEENVVPLLFDMLTKNEIDDMSAVYIDALVGTKELSYRLEKRGSYVEDLFLKHFKESFRELRIMYRKEKERINMIYTLRRNFFQLMNLLNANAVADFGCVADVVQKLLSTVDDLIRNTVDVNLTPSQNKLAPLNYSNEETKPTDTERSTKRAKNQVQGLCMVLCNRVVGQNQEAIDVVAEAMLKSILAPHDLPHRPTMSLLFLGLTRVGQADFVRSVAENFICDDGTDLLIQIDLSKYRDPDSLFQLIHWPLELPFSHSQHGVPLLEIVQMRPHSILLFSQVEMAHISVFSALLSVLDQGTLSNVDGHTVDFRHTVVIFASNVGNRRLLAHLVGHASQDGASHEVIQQEKIGFRYELLNRVDEIVLFNPFAREQLRKVARLSMRDGSPLTEGPPLALSTAFLDLFNAASDPIYERFPSAMEDTASFLAKGFVNNSSSSSAECSLKL
ncbi:hypothetical protein HYC85_018386 [Camellia sinensis]|uniref:ATPase AAA-type core domain-containing protein n=1 Tax=Camellia sinensis TaxID=4442 RepID=A0A7J7GU63_CAMSI|nr:hypothetical protein HYC85_018386 [Camellia sinensis]